MEDMQGKNRTRRTEDQAGGSACESTDVNPGAAEMDAASAGVALDQVDRAARRARNISLYKGADLLYFIWGGVWTICFICEQFMPVRPVRMGCISAPLSQLLWLPVLLAAIILSVIVFKKSVTVKSPLMKPIGIFWGLLFAYAYAWMFILSPIIKCDNYALGARVMTAYYCTIPMFAYVVMGLFGCGIYMTWLGLGISAMTCVGLAVAGQWFYLWMAIFGGAPLLATGFIVRRKWRRS